MLICMVVWVTSIVVRSDNHKHAGYKFCQDSIVTIYNSASVHCIVQQDTGSGCLLWQCLSGAV